MTKFLRGRVAALAAATLGLGLLTIPAALANPAGCGVGPSFDVSSNGTLTAKAVGTCGTAATRVRGQ